MSTWVLIFIALAGGVFVVKMLYVFSVAMSIPVTKGALFVSTSSLRIKTFLDAVPMKADDSFIDIGCGDGRVVRAAHRRYQVRSLGLEINPLAYLKARVLSFGIKGVRIRWKDFRKVDISEANVIFCYLFPDVMKNVAEKLETELVSGARVVSCNFPLPGWRPKKVLRPASSRHGDPIYIYQFPEACVRARL
ncbi:MAG: class I SAM-dependent methyltransferase [Deltaproteobacteria bacterium]|nr:class I SAM-dependent methyltransferase [Deltaproteobacteria bacterium]MBW2052532.1 class I SAM-dependent methyltransferase [Deltaproteobacteria bacterium]MBW2140406.1 class I SAM-dependent methyltransferase [Deltaproteobacteria bacterium]MBW2324058.1 class I SAM-dependent methyltransferase [Deltaproteobacteria bacterium]